jgi:hypothetical protein
MIPIGQRFTCDFEGRKAILMSLSFVQALQERFRNQLVYFSLGILIPKFFEQGNQVRLNSDTLLGEIFYTLLRVLSLNYAGN